MDKMLCGHYRCHSSALLLRHNCGVSYWISLVQILTFRGRSSCSSCGWCRPLKSGRGWGCRKSWRGWCWNCWIVASVGGRIPYQSTRTGHDVTLPMFTALNKLCWVFIWKVEFAFCCILRRTWVVVVAVITNLWFNCCRWCDWFSILSFK